MDQGSTVGRHPNSQAAVGMRGVRSQVSQPKQARAADQVIQVGDIVMGRVTRITTRQASVEIICVGETVLREPHRGIVRKEVRIYTRARDGQEKVITQA